MTLFEYLSLFGLIVIGVGMVDLLAGLTAGRWWERLRRVLLLSTGIASVIWASATALGLVVRALPHPLADLTTDVTFPFVAGLIWVLMGADLVVRGGVALARQFRIPPAVVGLTIVSLASTAPELVIVASASAAGQEDLALSNVIGCNIANLFLILGLPAMITHMDCGDSQARLMGPLLLVVCVVFTFLCVSGPIGPADGALLVAGALMILGSMLGRQLQSGRNEEVESPLEPWPLGLPARPLLMLLFVGLGAALLPMGAGLIVEGAESLALELSVPVSVVGITVVSLGTSLPELATAVTAAVQGRTEMAVGNILGSSVLNVMLVMGVGAVFAQDRILVPTAFLVEHVSVMVLGAMILAIYTARGARLGRRMGALLVLGYVYYIVLQVGRL